MTKKDENQIEEKLDNDLLELQNEINELENEEKLKKENFTSEESKIIDNDEVVKLKELLYRTQADYQNFKFRSQRDRDDMIFFLKYDIFKKILPRIDDLERMIKNTPEESKNGALYEGVIVLEKLLKRDLDSMGVIPFDSIGKEIDPNKHEVMTQIPSENPGIIVDEFEKGYMLGNKILRVAKVIVGS